MRLGNGVTVAADTEFALGSVRPYNSLLGVFWGTGVGGGLVLDGKPWISRDVAGEIGHVVVRIGGALCGCGRRGYMGGYAGRASMEARPRRRANRGEKTVSSRSWRSAAAPRLTSGVWARAPDKGDPLARSLLDRAVRALGAGWRRARTCSTSRRSSSAAASAPAARGAGHGAGPRGDDTAPVRRRSPMPPSSWQRSATSAGRSAPRSLVNGAPAPA